MNTYKNKLVLEIIKEIKEYEEEKKLKEKKIKIKEMLHIISDRENIISEKKKEIEKIEKQISELKSALEKEDFSLLSSWINQPYGSVVGIDTTDKGCTTYVKVNDFFRY